MHFDVYQGSRETNASKWIEAARHSILGPRCISYLQNLVFRPFKSRIVQTGVQIDLGGGHNLEFVIAPNLHWPDTMFTYDHKASGKRRAWLVQLHGYMGSFTVVLEQRHVRSLRSKPAKTGPSAISC